MLNRFLHHLKLSYRIDMGACPTPTEMSNSTQRAVFDSGQLERTASCWMVILTCSTLGRRTIRSIHPRDLAWQLRTRRRHEWHLGAFENGNYKRG